MYRVLFCLIATLAACVCSQFANMTEEEFHTYNAKRRISIGYIVFEGFETLDVFGPLQFIIRMSVPYNITLSIISKNIGPVSTKVPGFDTVVAATTVATHTPGDAPLLNLLIVPGGLGNMFMGNDTWIEDFISTRFASTDFIASVCTGASSLVKAGVLDGKIATTNKAAWSSVVSIPGAEKVQWMPNARWIHDGKIWTSSGVAAGMDMTYAMLRWLYGDTEVNATMNSVEYAPHINPTWDPFAVVHKVPGADYSRPLKDLVGPVGYD